MINSRLQRHFWTFALGIPLEGSVKCISSQMLEGYFEHFGFPPSLRGISRKLLDTVVNLHKEIVKSFMPTTVKFYYNFNMRDTSQALQSLLRALPTVVKPLEKMILLCTTEAIRVYADRLIDLATIKRRRTFALRGQ
jgi:dynein heavy chain